MLWGNRVTPCQFGRTMGHAHGGLRAPGTNAELLVGGSLRLSARPSRLTQRVCSVGTARWHDATCAVGAANRERTVRHEGLCGLTRGGNGGREPWTHSYSVLDRLLGDVVLLSTSVRRYQRCGTKTPGFSHGDEAPCARRHRHPDQEAHLPLSASSLPALLPAYRRACGNSRLWSGLNTHDSNARIRRSPQTLVCLVRRVRPRNPPSFSWSERSTRDVTMSQCQRRSEPSTGALRRLGCGQGHVWRQEPSHLPTARSGDEGDLHRQDTSLRRSGSVAWRGVLFARCEPG